MPVRDLSAGVTARLGDRVVYPALFFEGTFWNVGLGVEQLVNVWSGLGPFSWDSKTWLGQGNLVGLSSVEESTQLDALGFVVSLSGQNSSNISLAKQGMRQGKPGKVWLALLTAAGALADTPYRLKRGKLNIAVIDDNGPDCKISVTYGGLLSDQRARERRYTHEDQQIDYPGDLGFQYVPLLQDMTIPWGRNA